MRAADDALLVAGRPATGVDPVDRLDGAEHCEPDRRSWLRRARPS
ncbi:MAG: hypothetical protein ABIX10_00240 [Acidimicrobiales bacterium]